MADRVPDNLVCVLPGGGAVRADGVGREAGLGRAPDPSHRLRKGTVLVRLNQFIRGKERGMHKK